MKLDDLIKIYDTKKRQFGEKAYLHISEIFNDIREEYKKEYLASPKAQKKRAQGKSPDAEQSWKPFKGSNFEKLVLHIIEGEIESLNLKCVSGNSLGREDRLPTELSKVYYNLVIRYGRYSVLPDADLVIYDPKTSHVIGIISCKITLRERVAQTAYWKLKFMSDPLRMHIKGYLVTADEDGDLVKGMVKPSRDRIIVEHDLDGTYVLRDIAESDKVKAFPKLIEDIRRLVIENKKA
ncbi:MAG: DNA modification methylase [Dehalococcoidia bacterium]|nr:DNA modification methylase [Dehalococcoidia bacterium]